MHHEHDDVYETAREAAIEAAISDLKNGRFLCIDDAAWVYDLSDYTVWARLRELGTYDEILQKCRQTHHQRRHDTSLDPRIEAAIEDLKNRHFSSIVAAAKAYYVNIYTLRARLKTLGMYDRVVRQCKDSKIDLDVEAAIDDLITGRILILGDAAKEHGVHVNTLRYHLKNRGIYHQFLQKFNYFESPDRVDH